MNSPATAIEYIPLKDFEDSYEIMNQYPYDIRDKQTKKPIKKIYTSRDGIIVYLNDGHQHRMHRLIANQFIPEFTNKKPVFMLNDDMTDLHLENITIKLSERNKYRKQKQQK
ncbi:hypothetical protein M9Y10_030427 [Tritrichomonas musculus]|uniref:Uncharacterized protein n=1 Tax=Tritrichomonas musculus TaxID=1915356 RepID=A0ABR2H370_9EUKA